MRNGQGRTHERMAIGSLIANRIAAVPPLRRGRAVPCLTPPRVSARDWLTLRIQGDMPDDCVIHHAPSMAFQSPGGGENQLVQTGRYLEARGLSVRPFVPWVDRIDRARLLHLFGMSREGLQLAKVARAKNIPVVLSPICWIEPRAMAALATDRLGRWANQAKWRLKAMVPRFPTWRRELLRLADMILPNSTAEGEQLVRWFGADPARIRPVPNGVEDRFTRAEAGTFIDRHGDEDFVLYVGRIEPRKNVLGLIKGASKAELPVVVIGDALPGYEAYAEECRRAGNGFTRWLRRVDHDDPILESAYKAARVLALPSWFETPGLVALEAAMAGTAVVITPHGCTREYFGERVAYARPDRVGEIASALRRAWEEGPDPTLASHVAENYPWSEVARQTAEAYDRATR